MFMTKMEHCNTWEIEINVSIFSSIVANKNICATLTRANKNK